MATAFKNVLPPDHAEPGLHASEEVLCAAVNGLINRAAKSQTHQRLLRRIIADGLVDMVQPSFAGARRLGNPWYERRHAALRSAMTCPLPLKPLPLKDEAAASVIKALDALLPLDRLTIHTALLAGTEAWGKLGVELKLALKPLYKALRDYRVGVHVDDSIWLLGYGVELPLPYQNEGMRVQKERFLLRRVENRTPEQEATLAALDAQLRDVQEASKQEQLRRWHEYRAENKGAVVFG